MVVGSDELMREMVIGCDYPSNYLPSSSLISSPSKSVKQVASFILLLEKLVGNDLASLDYHIFVQREFVHVSKPETIIWLLQHLWLQVAYMATVGSFPFNSFSFNSFLSGILSCVGTTLLAVCLCIQVNKENKEFKSRHRYKGQRCWRNGEPVDKRCWRNGYERSMNGDKELRAEEFKSATTFLVIQANRYTL